MKKLPAIISACVIVCIFLSSCSSNLTIAKRHYRKGFYIQYAKHNLAPQTINTLKKKTLLAKRTLPSSPVLHSGNQLVETSVNRLPLPNKQSNKNINEILESHKPSYTQNVLSADKQTIPLVKGSAFQKEQVFADENEYHDGGGERAALSLLWIVIVVILILWLIGILAGDFGLGALINILLVIALILLILWLLRIA